MPKSLTEAKKEIDTLQLLSQVVDTWEQVAAKEMKQVRGEVLTARAFFEGLREMFPEIRRAWKRQRELEEGTVLSKNRGTLGIFLTDNEGWSGSLLARVFAAFERFLEEEEAEALVVGGRGRELVEKQWKEREYRYLNYSEGVLNSLMETVLEYERVVVFHGSYANLMNQRVETTWLTGREVAGLSEEESRFDYIFEPSREEVTRVFETEVLASLLEQALHEHHLSKTAARLVQLDEALGELEQQEQQVTAHKRRLKKRQLNKKQLTRLAGVVRWNYGR